MYRVSKSIISIPSEFGLIEVPLRRGLDAHLFAKRYTGLLSEAIGCSDRSSMGVVTALIELVDIGELDGILDDIYKGARIEGSSIDLQVVYLPLSFVVGVALIILNENCKPILSSKYAPPRTVQGIRKGAAATANRSMENVSTSYLSDSKLLILGLANSDFSGGHSYQFFLEECPLQTFYDLLEFKTISESIQIEDQHEKMKQQSKRK
jgi:hypothetical protein